MPKDKKSRASKGGFGTRVWKFFASVKLTLGVLITLAATSVIGTVIEQDQPFRKYVAAYGEQWADIIVKVGANDMYHAWWFTAILLALTLNIIVCTFDRFPPKWKALLKVKPNLKPEFVDRLSNKKSVVVTASPEAVREKLLSVFKKKKYKVLESDAGGTQTIHAWKGLIGRFGSDLTHVSLLVILLGAIIGSQLGYKDFMVVTVGDFMAVPQAEFKLRLDKFWIDYYDTGQIRQYNSVLTVLEDGKEVHEKQIWVNEPLYYKGIRFYQSSWGKSWKKVSNAKIALKYDGKEKHEKPISIKWREKTKLPGTPYSVEAVGFVADFAFDEADQKAYSKSIEHVNPALLVNLYEGDKNLEGRWLFLNYPGLFKVLPEGAGADLVLTDYKGILFSGISVNKDPGTNVVWVGSCIMGLGFIFSFFIFHKRVWVSLKRTGEGTEVKFGAMINKNNMVIEKELKDIEKALIDFGKKA